MKSKHDRLCEVRSQQHIHPHHLSRVFLHMVTIWNENVLHCKLCWIHTRSFLFFSLSPSDTSSYIIYVGRYQLNGFNQHQTSHRVRQVVIPSGYSEPHGGKDLALVQLSTPVTWSDRVRPVCLPTSGTLFPSGMLCTVTGWGNIRDNGRGLLNSSHHVCICEDNFDAAL